NPMMRKTATALPPTGGRFIRASAAPMSPAITRPFSTHSETLITSPASSPPSRTRVVSMFPTGTSKEHAGPPARVRSEWVSDCRTDCAALSYRDDTRLSEATDQQSETTVEIHGEHLIHAARESVWHLLNDPAVLARITPGVTSLVPDGDDRYKATIAVVLGPVRSAFQGQVEVTDKRPPEAMTLRLNARGPGGGVAAIGRITLHEVKTETDATRVTWSGEPQLMGLLATVGGRLIEGAAKTQAEQFFQQLERVATLA